MAPVVIVGGGVIGVCTAYYLARAGVDVTLIEREHVAAGSSYGNAGLITPSDSLPLPSPGALTKGLAWLLDPTSPLYIQPRLDWDLIQWLWRFRASANHRTFRRHVPLLQTLSRYSLELMEKLIDEENIACHYHRRGLLILYRTAEGWQEGEHLARLVAEFGTNHEVWPAEQVREQVPQARPEVVGGIYYSLDAHVDPAAFVHGVAQRLTDMGVTLVTQTEVLDFEVHERRVKGLHTTRGTFPADAIVLAAGAWTPLLARRLGIAIPIQPAKGYSITVQRPDGFPEIPLILDEAKVGITPMGDRLRFAGTLELAGHSLDITARRVLAIRRAVTQYLNVNPDEHPLVELWRGLRPCTPDGLPIIGWAPQYANVIIAAGHCMLGMTQGVATGHIVADLLNGRSPAVDVHPFRVDRF